MLRPIVSAGLGLALLAGAAPARAQGAAGAAPPTDLNKVTTQIRENQEDLLLLRILTAVELSNAQLSRILPTVDAAQKRLKEQDDKDAVDLKARESGLDAARKAAARGTPGPSTAEQEYKRTLTAIAARRAQLRTSLVSTIRRALTSILTQEQLDKMVEVGREMAFLQRQAQWQAEAASGEGGGPLQGFTRMMDRMRDIPPAEWEKVKTDFVRQMQLGGRGGPGGGGPGVGGPGGGGPGGGGPGGGGPGGRQAARDERRAAQDAQRQAVFMQMADQVRGMPADQYNSQRFQLAAQAFRNMIGGFQRGNDNPDEAINSFIDRYFLSPRIVPAVKQKTGVPG